MINLKSDVNKKNEIMKNQVLGSLEDYKKSFIQAANKLDKFLIKLPISLNVYLITYEQLQKSLISGFVLLAPSLKTCVPLRNKSFRLAMR